jgi:hypothetical protein
MQLLLRLQLQDRGAGPGFGLSQPPQSPFQVLSVDDPHDCHQRLVNSIQHTVLTWAERVEREGKSFEPFDSRRVPDWMFFERQQGPADLPRLRCG